MSNPKQSKQNRGMDANRDPLSGTAGSHPIGTGVGAAGGGTAGAAVGTAVGGPVGGVAGAAVGAFVGGLAGKGVAEEFDPTVEVAYWREVYVDCPYYDANCKFEVFEPAYRYGWESRRQMADKHWNDVEKDLERGWMKVRGKSTLTWERAKGAVRDAWDRLTGKDHKYTAAKPR